MAVYLRPYWARTVLASIMMLIGTGLSLLTPYLIKVAIDQAIGGRDLRQLVERHARDVGQRHAGGRGQSAGAVQLQRSAVDRGQAAIAVGARKSDLAGTGDGHATRSRNVSGVTAGRALLKHDRGAIRNVALQAGRGPLEHSGADRRSSRDRLEIRRARASAKK